MKKRLWTIFLTMLALLCLTLGLAACGEGGGSSTFKTEGTYYLVEHDEYDMDTYFTLKGGKWTDDDGVSGDYEIKGENITLYSDLFGSKMVFTSGTVKGGILTLGGVYGDRVYAQKGAWSGSGSSSSGNQGSGNQTPSAKEYTVTYDANGGAFADGEKTFTQKVKDGNKLTAPASPTRSNYTFAGWAKSKNGSTMWKFDEDTVSENTTLFAQWTQESAVILSVDGASIEDRDIFMLVDHTTGEVSLSNKVVCSDDSIWRLYSDPEGQREIPTKMVTNLKNGDNTYYIVVNSQNQAQVNVYKLTVHRSYLVTVSYYNGETLLTTKEAYTGDTFTASYRPDITGYTFNKWKTAKGAEFTSDVLWGSLALYADKTANTYKVTFDVNGGDALTVTEKQVTYDSSFSLPVPKRTGYSFTGWYVGSTQVTNTNGSGLKAWNYGSGKEVTAHWQANDYAVTLKQNDEEAGTVSGGGDHAYDSQVTITATTNTGYNFLGWYDKDGELVSENAKYTFKMGFAVSYTAKWDYYTLTTARNDASAGTLSKTYSEEKISVGTKVTLKAITNKGYTWVGWYKGEEEVSKELTYQYTMTKANVTFEARWIACPVTVQSNDETAGTVKMPDTTIIGQEVTLTATTNKGYTFVGWYKGEEEVSKDLTYQYTMTKENVTLEARWTYYTLTTTANDTQAGYVSKQYLDTKVTAGDEVTLTAITNKGYTWVGWYKGDDEVSKELTYQYTMTKENVTLEARWSKVTLSVNDSNAGSVKQLTDTYKVGDEVTLTATTNKGYTFVGWYKDEEEVSKDLTYRYTMTKENVTFEARWEAIEYSLTLVYDSDVGVAEDIPTSYTIKGLNLPTLIGKNGNKHISIGWWNAEDGTKYTDKIPEGTTGELTLTVIWGVTEGTHSWKDDNTCSVCGAKKSYTKSEDGTKIYFGEYPQTEVKESDLKASLGWEAGANPTSSNAGKWTDYGYYISGSVRSYMWYIDVSYQGNRYRGVYFTSYRPYYTTNSSSTNNSYQDDNGYKTNTAYWFKYEPIEWRIWEQKDGTALLMANIILDSQQYYRTDSGTRTVGGKTVYPNNYKESDIRAWLNETFYETAFGESAKQIIETTTVDNSASSTASSSNPYACENTQDKVFLLSWKEILNTSYGFSSSSSTYDTARRLKSTDYAKSQGCWQSTDSSYRGNGWWWLRSPYSDYSGDANGVNYDGYAYYYYNVDYANGGVVPALRIRL